MKSWQYAVFESLSDGKQSIIGDVTMTTFVIIDDTIDSDDFRG